MGDLITMSSDTVSNVDSLSTSNKRFTTQINPRKTKSGNLLDTLDEEIVYRVAGSLVQATESDEEI